MLLFSSDSRETDIKVFVGSVTAQRNEVFNTFVVVICGVCFFFVVALGVLLIVGCVHFPTVGHNGIQR